MKSLPLWCNDYIELKNEYIRLFSLKNENGIAKYDYKLKRGSINVKILRTFFEIRKDLPIFIDWSGEKSNKEVVSLNKKIIESFISSNDKNLQAVGCFYMNYNNPQGIRTFFFKNFDLFYSQELFRLANFSYMIFEHNDSWEKMYIKLLEKAQGEPNIIWPCMINFFYNLGGKGKDKYKKLNKLYLRLIKHKDEPECPVYFFKSLEKRFHCKEVKNALVPDFAYSFTEKDERIYKFYYKDKILYLFCEKSLFTQDNEYYGGRRQIDSNQSIKLVDLDKFKVIKEFKLSKKISNCIALNMTDDYFYTYKIGWKKRPDWLYILDMQNNEKFIKIPDIDYDNISLAPFNDKMYLAYSQRHGSGIFEIDIQNSKSRTLVSSRNKNNSPLENGVKYNIRALFSTEKYLFVCEDKLGLYIYNIETKKWIEITLNNIDSNFIKNNVIAYGVDENTITPNDIKFNIVLLLDNKFIKCPFFTKNTKVLEILDSLNIKRIKSENGLSRSVTYDGKVYYTTSDTGIIMCNEEKIQAFSLTDKINVLDRNDGKKYPVYLSNTDGYPYITLTPKFIIIEGGCGLLFFSRDKIEKIFK